MKTLRVQIESMDDEGRGRATFEDFSGEFDIAVRGAFVGDDVEVQPERLFAARRLIASKATHYYEKGECHRERICAHPAPCPTCPLHGASASLAAEIKRGRIERALWDAGLEFDVDDMIFHPSEFGYRQKVKLMTQIVEGELRLGVYVPYSHDFVVAENCPYVQPAINEAIPKLLQVLNSRVGVVDLAQVKAIILRACLSSPDLSAENLSSQRKLGSRVGPHSVLEPDFKQIPSGALDPSFRWDDKTAGQAVACVVVAKQALSDTLFSALSECVSEKILISLTERVHSEQSNSILAGDVTRQLGPAVIAPLEGGPPVDPDSFCQSDPVQATVLYDLVAEFLTQDNISGSFVDAYAGVGGFTRALQRRGATNIVAIEQSPSALSALQQLGVSVVLKSMGDALREGLPLTTPELEGLVVDPPKKGLLDDAPRVAALGAKRVALVSCDPDAMARDLQAFLDFGYVVQRIIPVDLFGGTPAIESVVLMRSAREVNL